MGFGHQRRDASESLRPAEEGRVQPHDFPQLPDSLRLKPLLQGGRWTSGFTGEPTRPGVAGRLSRLSASGRSEAVAGKLAKPRNCGTDTSSRGAAGDEATQRRFVRRQNSLLRSLIRFAEFAISSSAGARRSTASERLLGLYVEPEDRRVLRLALRVHAPSRARGLRFPLACSRPAWRSDRPAKQRSSVRQAKANPARIAPVATPLEAPARWPSLDYGFAAVQPRR